MKSKTEFRSITNIEWEVNVAPFGDHMLCVDGVQCRGSTHFETRRIYLSSELSGKDLFIVLVHELTHALIYDTQIERKESYNEENVCDLMSMYAKNVSGNC